MVSWSSKKQNLVAHSSTEVEYQGMAHTMTEVLWIQSLLHELRIPFQTLTLLCDNLSAVLLSHNPTLHARTKHMIKLDIHFIREKVASKTLVIQYVPAADQMADSIFYQAQGVCTSMGYHSIRRIWTCTYHSIALGVKDSLCTFLCPCRQFCYRTHIHHIVVCLYIGAM